MSDNLLLPTSTCSRFTPKQVAVFFFKPLLDENDDPTGYHVCKACGKHRKQLPGKGFTNLESHVRVQHPSYERKMSNAIASSTGTIIPWVSQKASNRFGWLEWIKKSGLSLSFCEQELARRSTNLAPVSVDTLRANMESVTREVEALIGAEMPDVFALMLDGWSNGSEHYLAIFACYVVT